jgi:hypothetical protein
VASYGQIVEANRAIFAGRPRPARAVGGRGVRTAVALGAALALAAAAPADAKQSIAAAPNPVHFGEKLTVTGKGWPVIEFCSRTVRFSLRSAQNAVHLGATKVGTRGRLRFEWVPRRAKVGAGRWTLRARMNCESGKDGSTVPVRASLVLRIAP